MVTCSVLVFLEIEDSLEVLLLCEYVTIAPECELRNPPSPQPSSPKMPAEAWNRCSGDWSSWDWERGAAREQQHQEQRHAGQMGSQGEGPRQG